MSIEALKEALQEAAGPESKVCAYPKCINLVLRDPELTDKQWANKKFCSGKCRKNNENQKERAKAKVEPVKLPRSHGERGQCLDKAKVIINGERQTAYGNPEDSFGIIAEYWETYLGSIGFSVKLRKSDVTLMMSLFKHARMSGQKYTEDNFVDAAGYLGLSADFQAIESKTEGIK